MRSGTVVFLPARSWAGVGRGWIGGGMGGVRFAWWARDPGRRQRLPPSACIAPSIVESVSAEVGEGRVVFQHGGVGDLGDVEVVVGAEVGRLDQAAFDPGGGFGEVDGAGRGPRGGDVGEGVFALG